VFLSLLALNHICLKNDNVSCVQCVLFLPLPIR
jgi:hypothetical protein